MKCNNFPCKPCAHSNQCSQLCPLNHWASSIRESKYKLLMKRFSRMQHVLLQVDWNRATIHQRLVSFSFVLASSFWNQFDFSLLYYYCCFISLRFHEWRTYVVPLSTNNKEGFFQQNFIEKIKGKSRRLASSCTHISIDLFGNSTPSVYLHHIAKNISYKY